MDEDEEGLTVNGRVKCNAAVKLTCCLALYFGLLDFLLTLLHAAVFCSIYNRSKFILFCVSIRRSIRIHMIRTRQNNAEIDIDRYF